jgi:uncharacterized protein
VLRDGTSRARYLAEPPVLVMWEQGEDTPPRWVTALEGWGGQATPLRLRAGGGVLSADEVPEGTTTYAHNAAGSQGIADGTTGGAAYQSTTTWDRYSPPPGTSAAFTTEPFAEDTTLLGGASADLWITATAPNVDLQVTLTEVRPDGTEVFVQQGWLRTRQRALDRSETTELRPVHTHFVADAQPLSATEPSLARVEVLPFGHVVRAGSRLRMWVEAPFVVPQLQGFQLDPTPAAVTIHSTDAHPTSLVLPVADGAPVPPAFAGQAGQWACGVVQRQHCRPDPLPGPVPPPAPALG